MTAKTTEFTFACPHCGQHLLAEWDLAGIEMECPVCGKTLTVPHPDTTEPNKNASEEIRQAAQQFDDGLNNQQNSVSTSEKNGPSPKTQHRHRKNTISVAIVMFAIVGLLNVGILCVGIYFWSRHVKGQEAARAEQAAAELRREKAAREQKQMEMAARFIGELISAESAYQQRTSSPQSRKSWENEYFEEWDKRSRIQQDERIREEERRRLREEERRRLRNQGWGF